MEKGKRKPKTHITNPSRSRIEFISPLQPEECVQLLQQRHDPGWVAMFGARIRVDIAPLDPDTYEFKVERIGVGGASVVEVMGDLRRWEGTSTLVTAESQFSDDMYARWLVLCITIVGIPLVLVNSYFAERARNELIRIIQRSVGVEV